MNQEAVLFFKLYLLRRKDNYINYMEDASILAKWFSFEPFNRHEKTAVICGSCFFIVGEMEGGSVTMTCKCCQGFHGNVAYELQQMQALTKLSWHHCLFAWCEAVKQITKDANGVEAISRMLMF